MEVLKQLHTSVAQECERLFDDAYKTLRTDLVQRDAQLREVEERAMLADQERHDIALENQKLRRENILMREEIRRTDVGQEDNEDLDNWTQLKDRYSPEHLLSGFKTGEQGDGLTAEDRTKIVLDKYLSLYEDFQTLFQASRHLKDKIKRDKRKLHYWRTLLDRKEFSLVLAKGEVRFRQVEDTPVNTPVHPSAMGSAMSSTDQPVEADSEAAAGLVLPTSNLTPDKVGDNHSVSLSPVEADFELNTDRIPQAMSLAPASTQSDPSLDSDETTMIPQLPGHPTAQRTRILKRKRELVPDPKRLHKRGLPANNKSEQPILIRSESMSSSPLRSLTGNQGAGGTQDLDDIGDTVETPTKRKSNGLDLDPLRSSSNTLKSPPRRYRHRTEPIQKYPKQRTVLQPVDSNLRAGNDPSNIRPEQKSAKPARSSRHAIGSLAEDGDENLYHAPRKVPKKQPFGVQSTHSSANMNSVLTQKRLDSLLEQPLPSRRPLDMPRKKGITSDREKVPETTSYSSTPHTENIQMEIPNGGERSELDTNRSTAPGTNQHKSQFAQHGNRLWEPGTAPDITDIHPEEEPYRARPPHRLDLRHFKINPENNQGLDFAYDTVVRRKDERKCMTGCTRPGCCGDKFLAMTRLGGSLMNPKGSCQEKDEQRILEEYLGEENHILDHISVEDRQRLLHEAIARSMANTYGRHRHDHHRPSTPPGFWRTDMPDTQELEHDRAIAQHLEREKINERYREAMRGGLWKFADE
ncbi:SAE2 C-terminal domain-containing protein [Aspergillus clavatus NRRL 1]|uniref:DNA endonuclease activator Ctp1 C-terminal domain-containing protein n=1 Tax=Aspergillus clavatus (strain ATCC 1007 / CBS 513.65 / DSM 816 / NCTC 3887 / NRRL 1 / QM 1276 / 107) TaxID=344612 RepID=A1CQQ5_ASPCL|nr:uncharacterized protein ACLA_026980 [Aspergillus clavatus NRRL 1]EAW07976.1 conserved hypothetical protein [Aspergillus clavatus NRRL 1]